MQERIVIIFPTQAEAAPFLESAAASGIFAVEIGGVGMAETAAAVYRTFTRHSPSLVILAGIAGAYPDSGLAVGDVALVASECVADLGALRPDGFYSLYPKTYDCRYVDDYHQFKKVEGHAVNTAGSPYAAGRKGIENMEGAAFFSVCLAAKVRFLELRAVSNLVGDDRGEWNIPLAARNLAATLEELINSI